MILFFRSLMFNGAFYIWTLVCCLTFLPVLISPRSFVLVALKIWIKGVVWICKSILRLNIKIGGAEKFMASPVIFAVKHQSTWETLIFHYFIPDPSFVLKKELLWIPLFGWYLKKLGMIPLSRSKKRGVQDLKILLKEANKAISQGRPIIIFPEGTRSKPGQKTNYHSGIASLYLHLNIPVIPIAHNAGLYWPRRGFLKFPGDISLELLDPILPGLNKQEFMGILERTIEKNTDDLIHKGLTYVKKL
jgi:1-acyl-sn-glycerol-3-phosphate acyltransferase